MLNKNWFSAGLSLSSTETSMKKTQFLTLGTKRGTDDAARMWVKSGDIDLEVTDSTRETEDSPPEKLQEHWVRPVSLSPDSRACVLGTF